MDERGRRRDGGGDPGERPAFDRDEALERSGGGDETLRKLAGLFVEQIPVLMAGIRDAVRDGEAAELRRHAHTLKGSASIFAADPTEAVALRLETMGSRGETAGAGEALAELEGEVERLERALTALVNEG